MDSIDPGGQPVRCFFSRQSRVGRVRGEAFLDAFAYAVLFVPDSALPVTVSISVLVLGGATLVNPVLRNLHSQAIQFQTIRPSFLSSFYGFPNQQIAF